MTPVGKSYEKRGAHLRKRLITQVQLLQQLQSGWLRLLKVNLSKSDLQSMKQLLDDKIKGTEMLYLAVGLNCSCTD
jgi:hypothetical protein